MFNNADRVSDDKGLSAWHLILVFLAGVAVCGVFFSLGFLVGYNERSAGAAPVTERVSTPATIPPTLNTPLETTTVESSGASPSSNSVPPPLSQTQASAPASQSSEDKPATTPGPGPAPSAPLSPATAEKKPEPSVAATSPARPGEADAGFTVQVAASRSRQDAEALVKIVGRRGYRVFLITPKYAHANDNLYRVQVGPFTSKDEAEKARVKLKQQGFKPFIKH
jgi:cell division septation protein DedD